MQEADVNSLLHPAVLHVSVDLLRENVTVPHKGMPFYDEIPQEILCRSSLLHSPIKETERKASTNTIFILLCPVRQHVKQQKKQPVANSSHLEYFLSLTILLLSSLSHPGEGALESYYGGKSYSVC